MISFILYPSNYYKVNSKSFNQNSSPNYIKSGYDSIKYDLSIINWDYLLESANDRSDMLSICIEKLLLICNTRNPPTKFRKYRYPIHLKIVMNKFRYLHNIIYDNTPRLNWRKAQLNFETKFKEYNLDKEANVLSSDNKATFYKYLNNKLHSTNSI